jgi:membrane associated rhomboid family serine protease
LDPWEVDVELSREQKNRFARSTADGQFFRTAPCSAGYDKDPTFGGFPLITMIIIAANTIVFFRTPEDIIDRLFSLPFEDFTLPHLILITVASAFFHLDFGHLLMNMLLLGVLGAFLEPRLTAGQFLVTILLGIVLSSLISLNLLVSQADLADASLKLFRYPSTGASGAIAGLMGLFVLRGSVIWHSGGRSMRCPLLFFFPVLISATVLIGIFFIWDFSGKAIPAHDMTGSAGFWGHVVGFLGGLLLGLVLTLLDCDPVERREDVGRRQGNELPDDAGDWHHWEVLMPVSENASKRLYASKLITVEGDAHRG